MSETTVIVESAAAETSSCCGSCGTSAGAAPAAEPARASVFQVKGMTCGHCVSSVTAELKKIDGVEDVAVDLATGRVTVGSTLPLADSDVAAAIDEAGYDLVGRVEG
ncbi:heavy-metal-associated domain-containing protein [Kitasatospora sp. NPDC048298]|uniref:heavy-metal-associated domain-containing protein n=1 Tax=Kitasatospora sp. NPDC048298 TaxID=3364049 RepID=UPI0037209709